MKTANIIKTLGAVVSIAFLGSCDDAVSPVGSSLVQNEVEIITDTLVNGETVGNLQVKLNFDAKSDYQEEFDGRSSAKLLGRINVPEYGSLECSFVSQLMCSTKMNVPDSISVADVDSMRCVLSVPRGALTGDSLTPQQLKVYYLSKTLPKDIKSNFNPSGYYDSSTLLGSRSYTLSALSVGDSLFNLSSYINIPVMMPQHMAKDVFKAYRDENKVKSIFAWPANFEKKFHGVYVEQNFGNGCVGMISSTRFYLYWHYIRMVSQKKEGSDEYIKVPQIHRDSVCLFASQPEVLSSNRIVYRVSDKLKGMADAGKTIITTPGGYRVNFRFPVRDIIDMYKDKLTRLSVVSSMAFEIPAKVVKNDYGIEAAPYLLMVKKNEVDNFFAQNKIPDGKTSFYATYDSTNERYVFSGMRDYMIELIKKQGSIKNEDEEFVLVPVVIGTETETDPYTYSAVSYVVRCAPYIGRPTMTELNLNKAKVYFSFSRQIIK